NTILYRHAFAKRGRSISVGLTTGLNNRSSQKDVSAISTFYKGGVPIDDSLLQQQLSDTKGYSLSANIAYTEPIGKKSQLQFSYNPSFTKSDADQRSWIFDNITDKYSILDTSLSNVFVNEVTTHRGGITYRVGDRDMNLNIGLDAQHTTLD